MRIHRGKTSLPLIAASILLTSLLLPAAAHASSPINLGGASHFQILAGTALTIGGGVVGVDPLFDGVSSSAVADLQSAIATAATLSSTPIGAGLGGMSFTPGIYSAAGGAALSITGNVTLDGQGQSDPFFLFYTPAALNTTASIIINLINGTQPKDVYWVVGGAITTGASGVLAGTFMSSAAITTGASNVLSGCLLGAAAVTVGAASIFSSCTQTQVVVIPTGSLSISVPTSYQIPDSLDGVTATGNLGVVTVNDSRAGGSATSWIASVSSTQLTNLAGDSIAATSIAYTATAMMVSGGIRALTTNPTSLAVPVSVVSASGAGAPNSASWSAKLIVTIPLGQPAGSYTGTITQSVF